MAVTKTIKPSGGDYTSISGWQTGQGGVLAAEQIGNCLGWSSDLNDTVNITGNTTDANNFMHITVDSTNRHNGISRAGFRLSGASATMMTLSDNYTVCEYIEIVDVNASYVSLHGIDTSQTATGININHCLLKNIGNNNTSTCRGINLPASNFECFRNMVNGCSGHGITPQAGYGSNGNLYNNTVYNYNRSNAGAYGIVYAGSSTGGNFKNNLAIAGTNAGTADLSPGGATSATNGSSDTSGTAGLTNLTTAVFVSTSDLHIVTGATVKDAGTSIGTSPALVDYDIDGVQISGTWDVGADEFVAAGASISSVRVERRQPRGLGRGIMRGMP